MPQNVEWKWGDGVNGKEKVQCCLGVSIRSQGISGKILSSLHGPIRCLRYFHSLKIKIKTLSSSTPPPSFYGNKKR